MRTVNFVAVFGFLYLIGCGGEAKQPPVAEAASQQSAGDERSSRGDDMQDHMDTNFKLATEARDALVAGNLKGVQDSARELAFHDHTGVLPEHWMDDVHRMQKAAEVVATSTDLTMASTALAELASTCGDCHKRLAYTGKDRHQEHGLSPSDTEDVQARMQRHQIAADKLWYGLTIPSDAAWLAGARALTEAPLAPVKEDGQEVSPELNEKMEQVVGLGRTALEAKTREERDAAYAELLLTCAGCHSD